MQEKRYLCSMKRLVNELGVIAIATIFLLSLLQPFGIDQMGKQRMLLIVCGTLLTILSSFIAFMLIGRKKWSNVRGLLLFHAVNIPLLSAMVLTLLSWFTWDSLTKGWYCTAGEFSVINYLKVCVEVALLSFFILILQIYRLRNSRLQQELEEVRAINQLLEERQENKSIDNEQLITDNESVACVIRGNTKNAVLEVIPEHIVYVESMSNYTDICYLEDDSLRHHSLRITMKQLRESLSPYQYIIPCHRAFLVNLNFVVSLSGRPSTGCSLQMFQVEKPIPVARSYTKDIHDRLQAG